MSDTADDLSTQVSSLSLEDRIKYVREQVSGRLVFTTSLGLEDQVLTHLIASQNLDIELATLDTGRLFSETYALWSQTERHYGIRIRAFYPDAGLLEDLVNRQGINGFYDSLEARKACCNIRKTLPLARVLEGATGWMTGLRADQSANRQGFSFAQWDDVHGLMKINPLLDQTREDLVMYAQNNDVPVNPLHAQGFLSIGCAPCTRAVLAGEPERAGRWWWEQEDKKECGLHVTEDGRLVRAGAA